jgi:hypothetical protein
VTVSGVHVMPVALALWTVRCLGVILLVCSSVHAVHSCCHSSHTHSALLRLHCALHACQQLQPMKLMLRSC